MEGYSVLDVVCDRAQGALVGLGIGDAVGASLEGFPPPIQNPISDMVGGGKYSLPIGSWTDDSSMALCLAESLILSKGFDPASQQRAYLDWYYNGHLSSTGECFDIGIGTRMAVLAFEKNPQQPYASSTGEKSRQGNGSLMRLSPIAIRYLHTDVEKAIEHAANSSRTTHGAVQCVDSCRYFAALLIGAMTGASKEDLLKPYYIPKGLREDYWKAQPLCTEVDEVVRGSYKIKQPPEIMGTGSVIKSLESVLWAFLHNLTFREGLLAVVNLGNDADTTGAIFGQLGGAFYGLSGIPADWRRKLVLAPLFHSFASELLSHSNAEATGSAIELSGVFQTLHAQYMHLESAWRRIQKRLNPCPSMYRDLEAFEADATKLKEDYHTAFTELSSVRDDLWRCFEIRLGDKRLVLKHRLRL